MVIRIDNRIIPLLPPEDLNGTVCDDLIRIHIDGGAGAALNRVDDELVVQLAFDNLITGSNNRICTLSVQNRRLGIRDCAGFFDLGDTLDQLRMQLQSGNRKILGSPQCLNAIIGICRDLLLSD